MKGRELTFVARYARNGDVIFEHRGDQDGWTAHEFNPDTGEPEGYSRQPQLYMRNSEGFWDWAETNCHAVLWKHPERSAAEQVQKGIKDIRYVGMHATPRTLIAGPSVIWGSDKPQENVAEWHEKFVDGRYEVTAVTEVGIRVLWSIDPQRGWNAARVAIYASTGELLRESISVLKQYGDVWLPESTTYYGSKGTHRCTTTIRDASFNAPSDPRQFTAKDLGLEPGFIISPQDFHVADPHGLRWSGEKVVEFHEYDRLWRAGLVKAGPTLQARFRGERSPLLTDEQLKVVKIARQRLQFSAMTEQHNSLWLKYVNEFIKRYHLNEEQQKRAFKILRNCQDLARKHISKIRPQVEALIHERKLAQEAKDEKTLQRNRARHASLLQPIDDIFNRQLKPRLEKLPTRAQYAAARKNEPQATKEPPEK